MIRVITTFRGRLTSEQPIHPGDYTDDDPRLFGIADYLVSNGFATRLEAPETEVLPAMAQGAVYVVSDDIYQAVSVADTTKASPKPKRR